MAMTLRLTDEEDAHLTALAKALGVSKQQAVRQAVAAAAAQVDHRGRVRAATTRVQVRDANLLRRLSE